MKPTKELPVMEEFYSIQGEGHHSGKSAYFIRIGGCDIGCHWCDVKESWKANLHPLIKVDDIVKRVQKQKANAVVITGGEPLLYNLNYLCKELKKKQVKTYLETSGSEPLTGEWDWICLSPKRKHKLSYEICQKANELKVIIETSKDFDWATKFSQKVNRSCLLFLQPEWSNFDKIKDEIIAFVKKYPKWSLSLQVHKFLKIP